MSNYEEVIKKADQLSEEFNLFKSKLEKMLFYLEDDNKTGQKGIISRVSDLEDKVRDLNTDKKVNAGKLAVYVSVGGAILWIIKNFEKITSFIKKLSV